MRRRNSDLEDLGELIWIIVTYPYGWIVGLIMTGFCYFIHVKFIPSPENLGNFEQLLETSSIFNILLNLPLILTFLFLALTIINLWKNR
ncbi:hypothetical protein QUF74_05590 [Candidatus Halobeggiatoa sp. HSG11]|nr:hypothetical protein [Candidatus Halobeggiatoa sp. HSG11]